MSVDLISRFFFRKDLSTHEICIGIAMGDWTDQVGRCWAAVQTLAEKVNCTDRTVQKALRRFVELGIIRVQERQDRSSIYHFQIEALPHSERTRRQKEVAPGETGERRSPLKGGTGERHSRTGEPRSPRYVSDTLDSLPPLSEEEPPSEEKDLFGDAVKTAEQIKAEQESELIDFVSSEWKKLVGENPVISDIRTMGDARRKAIIDRGDRQAWSEVMTEIRQSRFLRGLAKPGRDRDEPNVIAFDWLLKPRNFAKVIEGNYRDKRTLAPGFDATNGRPLTAVEQATRNVASGIRAGRERRGFGGDRGGAPGGAPQLVDGRTHGN